MQKPRANQHLKNHVSCRVGVKGYLKTVGRDVEVDAHTRVEDSGDASTYKPPQVGSYPHLLDQDGVQTPLQKLNFSSNPGIIREKHIVFVEANIYKISSLTLVALACQESPRLGKKTYCRGNNDGGWPDIDACHVPLFKSMQRPPCWPSAPAYCASYSHYTLHFWLTSGTFILCDKCPILE